MIAFFDADDVAHRPIADAIGASIALSPSAFFAAQAAGISAQRTTAVFSDSDHARCVAAGRVALREFDSAVLNLTLSPSLQVTARQAAWYVACISQRLLRTVRALPVVVRDAQGNWQRALTPDDLIQMLLPRILDYGLAHNLRWQQPVFRSFHRRLAHLAARRLRRRKGEWLVTPHKLKLGFANAFARTGVSITTVRPTSGRPDDYADLISAMRGRGAVLPVAPLSLDDRILQEAVAALRQIGLQFSSRHQRAGWEIYRPFLERNAAAVLALAHDGATLVRAINALGVACYEANGWSSAGLLDAARSTDRAALVLNHNCHALTGGAVADHVLTTLFDQRKATPSTTHALDWTRQDSEIADGQARSRTKNARIGSRVPIASRLAYPESRASNGRFKVLHAANYQNWSDFFPFVSETADEFVDGIAALSRAAASIPGLDLVIRVRPKREVNVEVVRAAVTIADNVSLCTTDDDFLDQLAGADLLVSFFSTTVMQALQMGKPVLLTGSTQRYRQLPARCAPPTEEQRAAVYAVDDAAKLRDMLIALRDHHGRSLTHEEMSPFVFGAQTPDIQETAAHLVQRMREMRT